MRNIFQNSPIWLIILIAFGLRVVILDVLPASANLDEATNGLDALKLIETLWITPFLQNNFGRETLFFYLQGLSLYLFGLDGSATTALFALRFVSAISAILTLPLVYTLGLRLPLLSTLFLNKPQIPQTWIALLATMGLGLSYWHLFFSRLGLRAIILPPILLALIICFWRGWYGSSAQHYRWLIGAGLLLGLTAYTYLAARLLPLFFGLFILIEFFKTRNAWQRHVINVCYFIGPALLTTMPLFYYFWQNPQAISSRIQTISIFMPPISVAPTSVQDIILFSFSTLGQNILALLKIHFAWGQWLEQWPTLNPIFSLGFGVGWLICLFHWRNPSALFLSLWWLIGISPVWLSQQAWERQTTVLRGIMAWPAMYLISALGLVYLAKAIFRLAPKASAPAKRQPLSHYLKWTVSYVFLLVLSFSVFYSMNNYFGTWAGTYAQVYNGYCPWPTILARYIDRHSQTPILLSFDTFTDPALYFLLKTKYPTVQQIEPLDIQTHFPNSQSWLYLTPKQAKPEHLFVLLESSKKTAYLLPPLSLSQVEPLQQALKTSLYQTNYGYCLPIYIAQIFNWPDHLIFRSTENLSPDAQKTTFENQIELIDHALSSTTLKPGQMINLFLKWQKKKSTDGHYYTFVHLFNIQDRQRYGQVNTPFLEALAWPVNIPIWNVYSIQLPVHAPEGAYRFEVGLYQATTQKRLMITEQSEQTEANQTILGKIWVQSKPPNLPQYAINRKFENGIILTGFDLSMQNLYSEQPLSYTLYWQAKEPISQSYTVFNHLVDSTDNLIAQRDNLPQNGQYPTTWWSPDEIIADTYILLLPADLARGEYTLRVGLYRAETGQRLGVIGAEDYVNLPIFIYN